MPLVLPLHSGEAELVCRAMRKFDLDGNIDPDAADLGELIIKVGTRLSLLDGRKTCRLEQTTRITVTRHNLFCNDTSLCHRRVS